MDGASEHGGDNSWQMPRLAYTAGVYSWPRIQLADRGGLGGGRLPRDGRMHRLFTVRRPLLARLDAVLPFGASLPVWNKLPALQSVLDDLASVEASNLGIPKALLSWGVL